MNVKGRISTRKLKCTYCNKRVKHGEPVIKIVNDSGVTMHFEKPCARKFLNSFSREYRNLPRSTK